MQQVLCVDDLGAEPLRALLRRFGVDLRRVERAVDIPGSYWGEREAGLQRDRLYCRGDTPVHSVLHEACHYICMDEARRAALDRDAGGDYDEENAVCYLQILLADHLEGCSRERMCADMDAWGYTFRLGSAQAWFDHDAEDARAWLAANGLINEAGAVTFGVREIQTTNDAKDTRNTKNTNDTKNTKY